ncbi:MAG: T9SS type B sorting domain-containing protein [Saprospiraceae bacterium]
MPTVNKVFIDACANPEGANEFLYMTIGSAPYNWSSMVFTGSGTYNTTAGITNTGPSTNPSLYQRPISNNFISDPNIVNQLNAGVGTCSPPVFYVAPNPIPAGSAVIVRMSNEDVSLPGGNALSSLCGKGPVYVLVGNYTTNNPNNLPGFFRNQNNCNNSTASTNTSPCTRIATFNLGGGCIQEVTYNAGTFPTPGFSSTTGAFLTSAGGSGLTSDCYEAPACSNPPAPAVSPNLIEYCDGTPMPGTKIGCSNCSLTNTYFIYDAATGGNLVYSGPVGTFPQTGFVPPVGYNTYYVSQKFSFCNSDRTPIQIHRKPIPSIAPIPIQTFCESNSCLNITATGSAGATYSWSPAAGVSNPTSAATQICNTGTSPIFLTSTLNGCTITVPVSFTTNMSLNGNIITPPNMINCLNSSAVLDANPKASNINYTWSNGSTSSAPTVTTGGAYSVTLTDTNNGCTRVSTTNVIEDKVKPVIAPVAPIKITCANPSPSIPLSVSGSNLTYAWLPLGSGSNPIINNPGTYTVTVTNSVNGCTDTKSITVTQDIATPNAVIAPPPQLNCYNGGSINLNTTGTSTGSNITYNWTGPLGYNSTAIPPPAITQSGTYNLVVTNTDNGCTKTVSVNIIRNTDIPNVTAGSNQVLSCYNNGAVQLGIIGSPGWTYIWSNGSTDAVLSTTMTGTYSLTVTDPVNGCTRVSQATVTENKTVPVVSPIPPITITCANPNPSVNVNATGGPNFNYNWAPSGSGANPTFSMGGTYTVTVTNTDSGCKATQTLNVSEDITKPDAVISPPAILNCFNNSNISLSTTGTSTGPPYTYQWSGGNQTGTSLPFPAVTLPGTYSLTVTNPINGCTKVASVNVTQNTTPPNALSGPPKLLNCSNNGMVSIGTSTSAAYNYQWSNGATSGTQTVTTPGVYSLTATDPINGCTTTSSVTVTEDTSVPNISSIPDMTLTCGVPIKNLIPVVSGNNLQYSWSPSGAGATPAISVGGVYTLTLTDAVSGCTHTKTVTVTEDKVAPGATILPALTLNCFNSSSIALDPTGTSTGTNFNYNWSGPGGFFSSSLVPQNATAQGTYMLTVTNSINGCTKTASVNVTQNIVPPIASAGAPKILNCYNSNSVSIGSGSVSTYLYNWSNGNTNASQTVTQPGVYIVTVTDNINGCTSTSQVAITKDDSPPTANAGADLTINCYFPAKSLSGAGGNGSPLGYQWAGPGILNGGNTLSPTVNQSGIYLLTVTNITNGCTAIAQMNVSSDKNAPTVAALATGNLNCNVTSTTLDGNGSSVGPNFSFAWSGPNGFSNNSSLTPTITVGGNYTIVITNSDNGCTSSKTILAIQDITPPVSTLIPPTLLSCTFPSVVLQPFSQFNSAYFYTWSTLDGNFTSGTSGYTATADKAGTYTLSIINTANGCSSTASGVIVENKTTPVALIATANPLTCTTPQLQLNAFGSTTGSDISYNWTTADGSLLSGLNTLNPLVNKAGTYQLSVRNITNGCYQTANVKIDDQRVFPIVSINLANTVTCKNSTITIDASNSSTGSNFNYAWTAVGSGTISAGANTLTPSVTSSGVYELVITNTANACSSSKSISVAQDKTLPTANAGPDRLLTCTNNTVSLIGSGSQGANFRYAWGSAAGAVQIGGTTLTPTVSQAGAYTLTVTNIQNGCTAVSNVSVTTDLNVPVADAGTQRIIDCNVSQVNLDGSKSNNGGQYLYEWTTLNGAFVSGQNTLQPQVNKPGIYTLKITNTINNCVAKADVEVFDNRINPLVALIKPQILNCAHPLIRLDARASSTGTEFSYAWTTANGSIVSGADSNWPSIDKAGNYSLKIVNASNGCSKDTSINILDNFNTPKAIVQSPDIITCIKPQFELDASNSTNIQNATISWKLNKNANIVSGASTLKPTIDNSGSYLLILRDTLSQCVDSIEIEVTKDANIPLADAGPSKTLNCTIKTIDIQSTASTGPTISYEWSTNGGNILSGTNTLTPKIDQPGTYTLTVRNSANQCIKTASVEIKQDTVRPAILVLPATTLNCKVTVAKIDATGSSTGSKFKISWNDPQSGILSGANSLAPLVNKPGTYTLELRNSDNTCVTSVPVTIVQNIQKPIADAVAKDTITCRLPQYAILGTVNAASGLYTFEWKTSNGNFVKDQNSLNPIINKGGTYQLFVTDTVNYCIGNTQIEVVENTKVPVTGAGKDGNLSCSALQLKLEGTVSNGNINDMLINWSTANGNFVNGEKTLTPLVDAPGVYILKIENRTNGCFSIDTTLITQDANVPIVAISGGDKLDCATTSIQLDGTASSQGAGITFEWKAENGANIFSGANTLTPKVNGGGIYTLTIRNSTNNCVKSVQKLVTIDTLHADVNIEKGLLTCRDQQVWINSSVTKVTNYSINWTSANSILSKSDSTAIQVNTNGLYKVSVLNKDNQCLTSRNVEVSEDKVKPLADAGPVQQLICNDSFYVINATKSSTGSIYNYTWTSNNGQILSAGTSLSPVVKPNASYYLLVNNSQNGCFAMDTTTILNIKPQMNAAVVQHPLCNGGLGKIEFRGVNSGTPPFAYSIDGGKKYLNKTEFDKLIPGIYPLKVQDANGCEDSLKVTVIEPPLFSLTLSGIHKITIGDDIQFVVSYNPDTMKLAEIKWTPSDSLSCSDCLDPIIKRPLRGGFYEVVVKNDKGCEARTSTQLNVSKTIPIYAPTIFSPNGDKINDFFTLFANPNNIVNINYLRIYDRWGTLLFDAQDMEPGIETIGWDGNFRGEPLNPAVFIWYAEILRVDGKKEIIKGDITLQR